MNTSNKRRYIRENFTGIWVLLIPFLLYFHKAFGDSEAIVVFGHAINHGFGTSEALMWYVLVKVVAILSLLTWFFTTNYIWKYFIFVPLVVYSYTLIKVFDFIPVLKANIVLNASILSMIALVLVTILDKYYFRKRRDIEFNTKSTFVNKEFYKKVKNRMAQMKKLEKNISLKAYFYELYKSEHLMGSTFYKSKSISYISPNWRNIFDILICTLLVLMAPLYFIYELIPDGAQSYPLLGFTIDAHGFRDVSIFMWYVSGKLCIIIPLCIWFITCGHWWRYAILSPIVLFSYQLWGAYQTVTKEIDYYEYLRALPTILFLVVLLFFISNRIKYQARILDIYEDLSNEIEVLLNKLNTQESDKIKIRYGFGIIGENEIRSEKATIYLKNLNEMKKELLKHLDQTT